MSTEQTTTQKNLNIEKENYLSIDGKVSPARTIRKNCSLKPRKSLLKVRSLRPTRAVVGKLRTSEK